MATAGLIHTIAAGSAKRQKYLNLKALVNIVVDRLKKNRTVLADLYNYVQVGE